LKKRTATQETFTFACHKDIACFTRCCADLRLVLTPYDTIRLKNRLQLSSQDFLDRYTRTFADTASGLPLVRLKMASDAGRRCPFVRPEGCSVYTDRPGACRLYPLGQMAAKTVHGIPSHRHYFKVKESRCLGWQEGRAWTIQEWLRDQGLDEYNTMNAAYLAITTGRPLGVMKSLDKRQLQMYYTACYNLDAFRRFLFESSFRQRFDISPDVLAHLRTDDLALMGFAAKWLRFALFGENTLKPKAG